MNFRTTIDFLLSYSVVNEFILQDKYFTSLVKLDTVKPSINLINPNLNPDQNSSNFLENSNSIKNNLDNLTKVLNENNIQLFSIVENDLL
jgi:hypothetical protein